MKGRYAIYEMLGRRVRVKGAGRRQFTGDVEDVGRDIYTNEVVVKVGGRELRFREPDHCSANVGGVRLEYGGQAKAVDPEDDDAEVFEDVTRAAYAGDTLDEVVKAKRTGPKRTVEFIYVQAKKKRKRSGSA